MQKTENGIIVAGNDNQGAAGTNTGVTPRKKTVFGMSWCRNVTCHTGPCFPHLGTCLSKLPPEFSPSLVVVLKSNWLNFFKNVGEWLFIECRFLFRPLIGQNLRSTLPVGRLARSLAFNHGLSTSELGRPFGLTGHCSHFRANSPGISNAPVFPPPLNATLLFLGNCLAFVRSTVSAVRSELMLSTDSPLRQVGNLASLVEKQTN